MHRFASIIISLAYKTRSGNKRGWTTTQSLTHRFTTKITTRAVPFPLPPMAPDNTINLGLSSFISNTENNLAELILFTLIEITFSIWITKIVDPFPNKRRRQSTNTDSASWNQISHNLTYTFRLSHRCIVFTWVTVKATLSNTFT